MQWILIKDAKKKLERVKMKIEQNGFAWSKQNNNPNLIQLDYEGVKINLHLKNGLHWYEEWIQKINPLYNPKKP
jgi:hypothetical protein